MVGHGEAKQKAPENLKENFKLFKTTMNYRGLGQKFHGNLP